MAQILLDIYTEVQECLPFRRLSLCVCAYPVPDIERRYTGISSIESEARRFIREKPRSRRRETINLNRRREEVRSNQ